MSRDRRFAGGARKCALRLHMAVFTVISTFAGAAQAIDAARSLHPMVHIPKKAKTKDSSVEPTARPSSAGKATGRAAKPLPPPGTVDTNTASGKPFVAVKPNANCTVSAGAGDLEAQLRSCAGVAAPKAAGR